VSFSFDELPDPDDQKRYAYMAYLHGYIYKRTGVPERVDYDHAQDLVAYAQGNDDAGKEISPRPMTEVLELVEERLAG